MLKLIYLSILLFPSCQTISKFTSGLTGDGDTPAEEESLENTRNQDHSSKASDDKTQQPAHSSSVEAKLSRTSTVDDLQHKQALMWARISDLEDQLQEEKAKVELLQKKQRTGLDFRPKKRVEEDESDFSKPGKPRHVEKVSTPVKLSDDYSKIEKNIVQESSELEKKKKTKQGAEEKRAQTLAKAQDLYRSGSFGASIAELERGIKDYEDNEDGICTFWIARNWMSLKEYQTASAHLEDFSKKFAQSSYIPRAKLELARAQNQLGMRSKALQSYQDIIKKYGGQESAEMAQLELEKLKRNL